MEDYKNVSKVTDQQRTISCSGILEAVEDQPNVIENDNKQKLIKIRLPRSFKHKNSIFKCSNCGYTADHQKEIYKHYNIHV